MSLLSLGTRSIGRVPRLFIAVQLVAKNIKITCTVVHVLLHVSHVRSAGTEHKSKIQAL